MQMKTFPLKSFDAKGPDKRGDKRALHAIEIRPLLEE